MRKHTARRRITPQPPPGMRPMLRQDLRVDLGLVHHQNVDAIAKGEGTHTLLWQIVESVLTWSKAADLIAARPHSALDYTPAIAEMRAQLELATGLVERYTRTGRVAYTGPELQLARRGAGVMDELAAAVTRAEAIEAAQWSEARVDAMEAESRRRAELRNVEANRPKTARGNL